MARMVIMVGIPFANVKIPELVEKMANMDRNVNKGGTSGSEYYENICMKSVNQCIGRAIRHRNDYASIVLMDVFTFFYSGSI
jgi:chromosome transmission fidelity protein 1